MLVIVTLALAGALQEPPQPTDISPERIRATLRELCAQPRLAGTEESEYAFAYAVGQLAGAGLSIEEYPYEVFLPRQTAQSVHILNADGTRTELDLFERGFEQDPWSLHEHVPPMHGLTRPGKVRGRVVYAGRGTETEFASLKEQLGADLNGAIALVRYGGLYRGLKVQNAADAGCTGALLYSDRDDDGDRKGRVLPDGPWRPDYGIQRGSVYNRDGDPLTPGRPAHADAERLPIPEAEGLVSIPSLPISYGNAALLFGKPDRPAQLGWLDVKVEMNVEQDPELVQIRNLVGWIEGSSAPDEWVIFGGHRDAWGYGAVDNGTGTAVLIELARICGAAAQNGWKPDRTLMFTLWDAEEWGLVGSTEWVEEFASKLRSSGVAYVNMDAVVSGPKFGASCTPGFTAVLRDACADEGIGVPPGIGTPGGGSDHVPFLELAGMEVLNFNFGGGHGTYHSALDTPYLVERFLDPDFSLHARATRLALGLAIRLSESDTNLNGVDQWVAQADRALQSLELADEHRNRISTALRGLLVEDSPAQDWGHRFHRAWLSDDRGARSLLWRTNGYGADWYPEIVDALADGASTDAAVERVLAAIQRLSRPLTNETRNPGR